MATKNVDIDITWRPNLPAELILWVDDGEQIEPKPRSLFKGTGRIEFSYETVNHDDYHSFRWILVFPDRTLRELRVVASFDGGPACTVGAHEEERKHDWTGVGVAP